MNEYTIALTKKAKDDRTLTPQGMLEIITSLEGVKIVGNPGRIVNLMYEGSVNQLRENLGDVASNFVVEPTIGSYKSQHALQF